MIICIFGIPGALYVHTEVFKISEGGDFFCFCNRRDLISLHMCGTPHKLQILIMNEEIIRVLDFPENVRAKWGMYIDSANSCLREILDNATDESFTWKGCTEIMIDTDFNGYNLVADNGRGIPISMSQDRPGQTQADVSISVLHSGSKFTSAGVATVGTHGVGSACANALAEHYVLLSRITADNYDRSIPAVKNLWESKGPRSRKNLYYFTEYRCGYKTQEGADTLENIENVLWGNLPKGYRSIPLGYSTIVLFKPDPAIWGSNTKTELPIQNIRNFLLIQEKFYKRKVTVIANGEVMSGSGFTPYQFEILRSIIPADPSANPEVKVYITFDIDKSTLGPKQTDASMNGLQCSSGIHLQYAENCFESALKTEYKIKHRMLTPGLRMFALFLADDVQYSGQTKERCKSISKVKITDFADVVKDFQKIFRSNPEYWESHVAVLEQLAESVKNLTASEKAEKLQVGNSVVASYKLKNELGSKLIDATAGPSERWNTELFLCFTGDTEMLTCNNERISMVELEKRVSSGEAIYTLSCEPSGRIVPSKVIAARQVGFSDTLCKVTLDNGETFECTPDHLHMMRDGSYKKAIDLMPGESMMPCYFSIKSIDDPSDKRRHVKDLSGSRVFKHKSLIPVYRIMSEHPDTLIDESANGLGNIHRHHIDKNKLNDNPTNLLICSSEKHFSFHAPDLANRLHELAHQDQDLYNKIYVDNKKTESFKINSSLGHKKVYDSPGGDKLKEHLRTKANEEWSDPELRKWRSEETKRFTLEHPEWKRETIDKRMRSLFTRGANKAINNLKQKGVDLNSLNYNNEIFWLKCEEIKTGSTHRSYLGTYDFMKSNYPDVVAEITKSIGPDDMLYSVACQVLETMKNSGTRVNEKTYNKTLISLGYPTKRNGGLMTIFGRDGFGYRKVKSVYPDIISKYEAELNNNHRIVSVELISRPGTPVYCLEVDSKEHNFPLAAGIFSKNCEGLSASGSLIKGRKNSRMVGIMPLKGRVLNVDGMGVDKMLENKEFYTIFKAIGVGLDINYVGSDCSDPAEAFEKIKKASRYGKIIISTDADADGEAIANGLCYAISRFARFLINFGMVYLVESPFFKDYQGRYYFPSDPVVPGTEFPVGLNTSKPFKRFKGLTYTSPVLW